MNELIKEIKMKYDIALVVGRFQPYHNAHHKMLQYALSLGDTVLVVLGSAKSAPDIRNPFTPKHRESMIRACFSPEENTRLKFFGVRDYPYHENIWITEIQNIVRNEQEDKLDLPIEKDVEHNIMLGKNKVCFVGHYKDETSYYLKLFPQWTFEPFNQWSAESKILNATDVRAMYLEYAINHTLQKEQKWEEISSLLPVQITKALKEFADTETYRNLVAEYKYIKEYKENTKFKGVPFLPTFLTTDAVVTAKGHILLVKRGTNPGKDKLALPGGFLEQDLTLKENALKELKEETRIHVPMPILNSSIVNQHVFDYPKRSLRGRTVTHAFHIELNPKMEDGLPLVKGGDDASKAFWMSIEEFMEREDEFFEDHHEIAKTFLMCYNK
jgi:bifunctional NMN adenylyltransferase/nudix hydrolase